MLAVILSAAKNLLYKGRWVLPLAGLVVCGVLALTCHRDAPTPLPTPVAARVERHVVQSAVDSTEIKRLSRAAQTAQVKRDTAVTRGREAADGGNYRAAYALEDTALLADDREVALLGIALTRSQAWAVRGDSVIAAVLPLVEAREPPCRILWFVPCPTRRAVAVAAAAATAVAVIATPRLVKP